MLGVPMSKKITFLATVCVVALAATSGYAADMAVKAPRMAPAPVAAPVYDWGGFYIGANVGWGWNNVDTTATQTTTGLVLDTASSHRSGAFGGGQIGYNWVFSPSWLLGIEGDGDWSDIKGTTDACSATGCSHTDAKVNSFATLRGRVGLIQDNFLFFVTGGAAWVHGEATRTIVSVTSPANAVLVGQAPSASGTDLGWTAGGGVDWGFARNWSAGLEYRYMQVDTSRNYVYSLSGADRSNQSTDHLHTIRATVNFHFN